VPAKRALREVLARDFSRLMDEIADEQTRRGLQISDDEAMRVATEELDALRGEPRSS